MPLPAVPPAAARETRLQRWAWRGLDTWTSPGAAETTRLHRRSHGLCGEVMGLWPIGCPISTPAGGQGCSTAWSREHWPWQDAGRAWGCHHGRGTLLWWLCPAPAGPAAREVGFALANLGNKAPGQRPGTDPCPGCSHWPLLYRGIRQAFESCPNTGCWKGLIQLLPLSPACLGASWQPLSPALRLRIGGLPAGPTAPLLPTGNPQPAALQLPAP